MSNSHSQRKFIEGEAAKRGLKNLKVITRNVVELDFEANVKFDRVCSTEMFEQLRYHVFLFASFSAFASFLLIIGSGFQNSLIIFYVAFCFSTYTQSSLAHPRDCLSSSTA